jgi:hypothetical protein
MANWTASRFLLAAAGVAVSFAGLWWSHKYHPEPQGVLPAVGLLCAGLCVYAAFICSWVFTSAWLGKKFNWSMRTCQATGLPLVFFGCAVLFGKVFMDVQTSVTTGEAGIFIWAGWMAGNYCRRRVYPEITDRQFFGLVRMPRGMFRD